MIRWIFEDTGSPSAPCYISEMRPEVFDITFVVTKPILVHVRGGDFAQPAVVPRVRLSLGKAKAKGMKRASPPSKGARGAPIGAGALEPGQPDGGTVPRTLKRPAAAIPEILAAGVAGWSLAGDDEDLEPAEMGPHGGGPRELEAHVAEVVPQQFRHCGKVSVPEGIGLGCGKCRWNERGCRACRLKAGLVERRPGCWMMRPPPAESED